jgi:phosphoribosyl-AMP cyclohydrolase
MPDSENLLEEGTDLSLDFQKLGKVAACGEDVVPVAVQDAETKEVLILAYVNAQALDYTVKNRVAAFWSTSRTELWIKGATSGDTLDLVEIRINCEQNSLLYLVRPRAKGACHTKDESGVPRRTCYYRKLEEGSLEHL